MDNRFDFDPKLPDLPLAFDLGGVVRLFEGRWPGAADGSPAVTIGKCRLQDTKYQPATRCVTVYELQAARPGEQPRPTIGVVEISPAGVAHRLYDDDGRLPWLAAATDAEAMGRRFAALLGAPVKSCQVTPVRYKPGARCVFRYDLDTASGRQVFFGKLLREGAEQLLATISALHAASEAAPDLPRIPAPLAYWPEVHMLIQPAVAGGEELNTRAFDPAENGDVRERWLRAAGGRLAALHGLKGIDGPRRTLAEDLEELHEYVAPMAIADGALAGRYQETLDRLLALAQGRAEPAPVASHGTFRTDQFMIENGALVMIDLDSFCWSDPARDIGNFLAYLRWKAIRQPQQADFIEHVGRVFLDGYLATRPAPDQRSLALFQSASMLKVAGRRYRALTVKEWHLVPRLIEAADGVTR